MDKKTYMRSIIAVLIAVTVFFAGCTREQVIEVVLENTLRFAVNSFVADAKDVSIVVEHMQNKVDMKVISSETTEVGLTARCRISSPDLTEFAENFDMDDYETREILVDAIIKAIDETEIVTQEVDVSFRITENGYDPVELDDFLNAYCGGTLELIREMIDLYGVDNGDHNDDNKPDEPPADEPPVQDPTYPPGEEPTDGSTSEPNVESPPNGDDDEKYSKGLVYALNKDGRTYSVTGIGTCKDTKLVIPETHLGKPVTVIGTDAFANNNAITEVVLSNNIQKMEGGAFRKCQSLKTLYIGSGFVEYYYYAIYNCRSLENVYVSDANPVFKSVDGNILSKDGRALYYYAIGKKASTFTIPEGVTTIMNDAFLCGWQLKEITIPDYVTSIGAYAFRDCTSLESIVVPEGITFLGQSTFRGCTSLKNVTLPESLVELGYYVFSQCESLKELVIPNNVKKMGAICWNDSSLKTVYLPATIDGLKNSAFRDCTKLEDVYFDGTLAQWEALPKEENWNLNANAFTVHCTDGDVYVEKNTIEIADVSIPFDKIVIKYVAEEKYITGIPYEHTLPSGIVRMELCLSNDKMKALAFTVIKNEDGTFSFKTDCGKFLSCEVNNISFTAKENSYTKFVLITNDNGYYIKSFAAEYNGKPQYLEFWEGYLCCYTLNTSESMERLFVFDFEDAGEASGVIG